jgi:hypothetical protein
LTFTGDNAKTNDVQTDRLEEFPNTFESVNRIRCFNHIMQLSAKALMKSFTSPAASGDNDDNDDDIDIINPVIADFAGDDDGDSDGCSNDDDYGGDVPAFNALDGEEREELLANTEVVHETLSKVIIRSILANEMMIGPQASLCYSSFHYDCPPGMA